MKKRKGFGEEKKRSNNKYGRKSFKKFFTYRCPKCSEHFQSITPNSQIAIKLHDRYCLGPKEHIAEIEIDYAIQPC